MRTPALLATALLGLVSVAPAMAQPANSAPQPGLPPGAAAGAPNAQATPPTGGLTTTQVPASTPTTTTSTHHTTHHHTSHHATAKPAT